MTPAEEDALVCLALATFPTRDALRLAIREAYAKGREDAAKLCEEIADRNATASGYLCAAAIRKGE